MDADLYSFFADYMPHGHCYLWQPHLLWTNVISDLLIAASYFSIPAAMVYFARKRVDIQFRGLLLLFSAFIVLCGLTHLVSIYVVWHGAYGVLAAVKAATAIVSVVTAYQLYKILPLALDLPSPKQLHDAEQQVERVESRQVELELEKENEQIFRYATELSPIGLLIVDQQQIIRLANRNICSIMQAPNGSLEGQPLSALLPLDMHDHHSSWVSEYLKNPKQAHSMAGGRVINALSLHGKPLSLEINLSVSLYHGSPHVFASVADVSERVKIQAALTEKTDFLHKVLDKSINGLYLFDLKGQRNTYINERYTAITGYTMAELDIIQARDGNLLSLFHPDDLNTIEQHFVDVVAANGEPQPLRYRFKHKNGDWFWCYSVDCIYAFDDRGQAQTLLGTFIDVSDVVAFKHQTESIMREFKATFEQAAIGLAHVGLDGQWLRVNQMVCDIVGYTHDEMMKLNFQDITHPDDLNADLNYVGQVLSGEINNYQMEKRYIKKNGDITWVNLTVSLAHNKLNEADYFISAIECIDKQKTMLDYMQSLNNHLEESNHRLEQFAYAASHDLQEPLRKIVAFSDSLHIRLESKLDDTSKFELDRLQAASQRMRLLIHDLLQLSRTFKASLHPVQISLAELVNRAIEDLQENIQAADANITTDVDIMIEVDERLFVQTLVNLIGNAIKYRQPERALNVSISASNSDTESIIEIKDNGMGFDNRKSDYIFEAFGRLVSASQVEGSGMGLAICNQIIKAHGGRIVARSDIGAGASFTLYLPKNLPRQGGLQ